MQQENFIARLKRNCSLFPEETVSYYNDRNDLYETLNFKELYDKIIIVSGYLQEHYKAGDRLVLMLNTSLEFVVLFCACLHSKIIPIPLPVPRKNRKSDLLIGVIEDAEPAVVVSDTGTIDYLKDKLTPLIDSSKTELVSVTAFLKENKGTTAIDLDITLNDIAFLQYTSGSTGNPKGVMISHQNLASNLNEINRKFGHSNSTKALLWLPNYHDMGLIGGVLQPLYVGFTLILISPLAFLMKPLRWLQMISQHKINTSGGPGFAYDLCVERIKDEDLKTLDLSSWDVAFVGAEPIRHETLLAFYEKFKVCGFKKEGFYPCYGLAESTLIVSGGDKEKAPMVKPISVNDVNKDKYGSLLDKTEKETTKKLISSGTVLDAFQDIVIVSPETLTECKNGTIGEVWVSGPSVSIGYWGNEEQTDKSFNFKIKNDNQNKSYLRTGDLGFVEQGEIYITGRLKELVIIDGKNYFPQDIETVIRNCHPAIWRNKQASFSVEDIDGRESLIVLIEINRTWLKKDMLPVLKAIRRELVERFELYAKDILLLSPGSIPITSSGKIQRGKCKLMYQQNKFKSIKEVYGAIG